LEAGRHHVSIPEASVALDVTRCKDLISNGALLDALRLYDGPFLQGFWLSNCPEFEEWQELTRSEIERIIWRAARTLMESAEKEGDWEMLEEVTARALLADPYDEDVHRRRLISLAMLGDVRRANREHDAFVQRLRAELERSPSDETNELARRLGNLPRADTIRLGEADASDVHWPFVGRAAELGLLREAWRTVTSGTSRAVAVVGEAGIGKSRLCERFVRFAVLQGARILEGRCYRIEMRLPYSGAVDALLAGLTSDDIIGLPPAWSAVISELLPELAHTNTSSASPAADETARRRLFEAIARVLQLVSQRSPVVLYLDDLHWGDESTVALLHYLARRLATCRVMFLVALRPEELGAESNIRWLYQNPTSPPLFQELRVGELPQDSVEALLDHFAEHSELQLSDDIRALIIQRGAGRPLFITELLKGLRAARIGTHGISREVDEGLREFVPTVIHDLYARRLQGLGNEALDVISALAVLGRGASVQLVGEITGRSVAATIRGIEELLARGLLVDEKATLKLPHDLLREVVYRSLSAARRRMLHSTTATALSGHGDTQPGTLAMHYDLAGDRDAAYRYALRAAEASERVYAVAEVDFFLRMAQANADSDEERWRLQEREVFSKVVDRVT